MQTLLLRRGVEAPYRTLYRYCAQAFPGQVGGKRRETVPVEDGAAGKELQVDFGRLGKVGRGTSRERSVRGLVLTANVSRHQFCWVTYGQTLAEVIEGFEEAWLFFGGIFRIVTWNRWRRLRTHDAHARPPRRVSEDGGQRRRLVLHP